MKVLRISSIVNEVIKTIFCLFIFFIGKILQHKKAQNMQKETNKTKVSEQKTAKATVFRVQNFIRVVKLFVLRVTLFSTQNVFFKNLKTLSLNRLEIVTITSFTILLL